MNGKQRVQACLRRQPTDRIPIFMWFHPETMALLARTLEIPPALVGEAMGNDVVMTRVGNNYAMEGIAHERDGDRHRDDWGILWEKQGAFNQIVESPLVDGDPGRMRDYRFPYHSLGQLLCNMQPLVGQAGELFLGCDVSPCVFEMFNRLRGMEQALLDLSLHADRSLRLMERCADFAVALAQQAIELFPLDWLWTGDDVASQTAMLMSPTTWRELVKPHLARVIEVGKKRGLWVAYHCCGSLPDIIEDLIEIGVDVLNPIQYGCPGMGAKELKECYGSRLAFMGGVDTQGLLPNGTENDVTTETAGLIETLSADGGGYIMAASHTIPPETPMGNIFAMYAAAGLSREQILDSAAVLRVRKE